MLVKIVPGGYNTFYSTSVLLLGKCFISKIYSVKHICGFILVALIKAVENFEKLQKIVG